MAVTGYICLNRYLYDFAHLESMFSDSFSPNLLSPFC